MSQVLPYEQLIAAKLEQLPPLPALADQIWLRIEKGLDDDPPTGGEGNDNEPSGPVPAGGSRQGWTGWSFLIFLGAASLVLFRETGNIKSNDFIITEPSRTYEMIRSTGIPTPIPHSASNNIPIQDRSENHPGKPPDNTRSTTTRDSASTSNADIYSADSNTIEKAGKIKPDSIASSLPAIQGLVPAKTPDSTSSGKRKKPAGIPVANDEYKVVPQKDSTKQ